MQIMQIFFYFSLLKSIRYICGKKEQRINVVIWLLLLLFVPFQSYARFVCRSIHVCVFVCLCGCIFLRYIFCHLVFYFWFVFVCLFCCCCQILFCIFGWWSVSHFAIKFAFNDWVVYACVFFSFAQNFHQFQFISQVVIRSVLILIIDELFGLQPLFEIRLIHPERKKRSLFKTHCK